MLKTDKGAAGEEQWMLSDKHTQSLHPFVYSKFKYQEY